MEQTRIFEADTVREAISKAEKSFAVPSDLLEIEVMDTGEKKLFGFRTIPAKIKATYHEENGHDVNWEDVVLDMMEHYELPETQESVPDRSEPKKDLIGKAWVKDGSLYYETGSDLKPVIIPGNIGKVYRNNAEMTSRFKINDGDQISFVAENKMTETYWSLKVKEEKQQIELFVRPGEIAIPYLKDCPPAYELKLEYEYRHQRQNQLNPEDVLEQLKKMEVFDEIIRYDEINHACRTMEEGTFIPAEGKLPVDGKHGELQFNVEIEKKHLLYREKADGTLDFRESSYIPSVQDGDILGKVVPPEKGEDGLSVFGQLLKAKDGLPVKIKTGHGLEYDEESNTIISRAYGRPVVKRAGLSAHISILPTYTHNGDLTVKDGNISFIGAVEVTGDVYEGMKVSAEGGIYIHRNVMSAVLQARNDIVVMKNAINSTVNAGKDNDLYQKATSKLSVFNKEMKSMVGALKQLFQTGHIQGVYDEKKGLRPVIRVLADKKFKNYRPATESVIAFIDQEEAALDQPWHDLRDRLKTYISISLRPEKVEMEHVEAIWKQAMTLQEISETPSESAASITLSYTLNSTLFSSGTIDITGKGAVQSHLKAGKSVTVKGRLIGGRVYGEEKVVIEKAGSETGVKTIIETSEDGKIYIDEAFPDVYLRVGKSSKLLTEKRMQLLVQLDENGQIVISSIL
ncbi:flagellar assembly protein A [Salisediminibacterium selenitireducens]|uniref:RNA-binding protein KhpB N-terminal domain-containing protein n=1 Tax=Bacillus selenitireducens (strain ATCC 700615 / DSM 15326 / MLS10) TaxID=439292 RepID=D6XTH5_BACIE|nr:flagellar assembly protein A [Salisediminibacterium selenitireducens]ADH99111.1 protein of unknown function DUF342 [[Bacillus] selenitireducens MLS10]